MKPLPSFALLLMAACTVSTAAQAAKIYKCGSSYSQVPCADGVELSPTATEPSRQQQRAARKATEQDEKAAAALKEERLAQEKAAQKERQAAEKARQAQEQSIDKEKNKAKDKKKSKKEPEYFTAKVPAIKASQPK